MEFFVFVIIIIREYHEEVEVVQNGDATSNCEALHLHMVNDITEPYSVLQRDLYFIDMMLKEVECFIILPAQNNNNGMSKSAGIYGNI